MSKRWTEKEDKFIVAYWDAVGSAMGPHDLGRSEKAVLSRYQFLQETGAWECLQKSTEYYYAYRKRAGFKSFEGFDND